MTTEELYVSLIPQSLPQDFRSEFQSGFELALKSPRPSLIDVEKQFLSELGKVIPNLVSLESSQAFVSGFDLGIDCLIRAESLASDIYQALASGISVTIVRRLLVQWKKIENILSELKPAERLLVQRAFGSRYNIDLKYLILTLSGSTRSKKIIKLLKDTSTTNNSQKIASSSNTPISTDDLNPDELKKRLEHSSSIWAGLSFLGKSAEARAALVEQFEESYGSIKTFIRENCRSWERELIFDLIEQGRVTWGKLLYLCVIGVGTDEDGLRELLEDMSPEEIQQARVEFKKIWKLRAPWYERPFPHLLGDLEKRIWIETGGDVWFDLNEYFSQSSNLDQDPRERLERLYRHERSGILLQRFVMSSRESGLMNKDVSAVRDFNREIIQNLPLNMAAKLRLETLIRFAELDCEIFRRLKHFIGNFVANVVATATAATAAFTLTFEHFEIQTIMICVALVSICFRLLLKCLLKGKGYHPAEMGADFFFGIFDGLTLFATYLFRQAIISFGTKFLTKLSVKTGLNRLSKLMGGRRVGHVRVGLRTLAGSNFSDAENERL